MTGAAARMVAGEDVKRAARRLHGRIRRTPLLDLDPRPEGARFSLKLECFQESGSFKLRGATNRILLDEGRHERVVAASGGNHGLAVAHACRSLGLAAEIFVSTSAPAHKVRWIEAAGARVHAVDGPFPEVASRCREFAERAGALFVHPFEDAGVVAGQGTVGLEILEQAPDVSHVVVAVGGGGLAAGVALAVGDRAHVVPAEPATCPTLAAALDAGSPVQVEVGGIAADSLGAPLLGELAYAVLAPIVEQVILVGEDEIRSAQRQLWGTYRLAVEPAAACAWAAASLHEPCLSPDAHTVVIACGGNLDLATLAADPAGAA
jgi:threonine dehydratase